MRTGLFAPLLLACMLLAGCGGGNDPVAPPANPAPPQPTFNHVVLVLEENHSFSQVIGNSDMPYLNQLASDYGLATEYYADAHHSIADYFMLTTGKIQTLDDGFDGVISDDNLVRRLAAAGKTWKSYAQSLPSAGYTGSDVFPYLKRHNPFAYLSDVVNDPTQAANLVPSTQLADDLASDSLPDFAFIVPDAMHDAHDGSLAQADSWLHDNIGPLIANSVFQQDGLLIITFDESVDSDIDHGGGHVATIVVGPKVKPQFQSQTLYQHESALRQVLVSLGISEFPGASATAPGMEEFLEP
jgi:acid phosphatase